LRRFVNPDVSRSGLNRSCGAKDGTACADGRCCKKYAPGRGLWALPGGFLEKRERLLQGALRELKEETGLDMAVVDAVHALREVVVFDHPLRSARGRILTHVHWFDLAQTPPAVQGADDAERRAGFPLTDCPQWKRNYSRIISGASAPASHSVFCPLSSVFCPLSSETLSSDHSNPFSLALRSRSRRVM
jgi:ADP-ribose pyrophosphatase YjhB (NUDIX family)